jgi:hypothetical protein
MAHVLLSFEEPVTDRDCRYHARVVGRLAEDRMWEGWLEFESTDDPECEPVIGPVESRQPKREHLVYWANGLTPVFLQGALRRARQPIVMRSRAVIETAASDRPAKRIIHMPPPDRRPEAVLDPFSIGSRSLDILDQELRALNRSRLLNIIDAHYLNPGREDLAWMSDNQLVRFIVVAVETQLAHGARTTGRTR